MSKILVTGIGGPAGRNVAQLLLPRGHTVIGTDMRDVPPCRASLFTSSRPRMNHLFWIVCWTLPSGSRLTSSSRR